MIRKYHNHILQTNLRLAFICMQNFIKPYHVGKELRAFSPAANGQTDERTQ